jgi:NhaA family Na+:H+ antiporter
MVAPAAIYAAMHAGGPAASGWGVPMATDIAFAVAALAIFGRRVPAGLKVFLLALAIVDDLGAVTVIAVFYTHDLSLPALAWAGAGLAFVVLLQRADVRAYPVYWIVGGLVWLAAHESGVHATVAGVLLGFLTPTRELAPEESLAARGRRLLEEALERIAPEQGVEGAERKRMARELRRVSRASLSPLERLTEGLHPWSAFLVMPVFALANAGIAVEGAVLEDPFASRVALAVALGLVVGKPVGITLFCWLAVRARLAVLPQGVSWGSLAGAGMLGGIGFTMALFITALAFEDPVLANASKAGVIVASVLSAVLGVACLARTLPRG